MQEMEDKNENQREQLKFHKFPQWRQEIENSIE